MFFFAIVVSLLVGGSEGLLCLQCNDVAQPRHCTTVVECPQYEVCYTERSVNDIGEARYVLSCSPGNACTNITSTSQFSRCTHCCDSNLCNNQACGEPGYPADRGLICYSCHDPVPAGMCHNIDFCRKGEECSVIGKQLFGTTVFTSQCQKTFACETHHSGGILVGKRDTFKDRSYDVHDCDTCCNADLCNQQCIARVNGEWSRWGSWVFCDQTCDQGTQRRSRSCSNPPPSGGGRNCTGTDIDTRPCIILHCPINGGWGQWSDWSIGCGSQTRTRACDNPTPEFGGQNCTGNATDTKKSTDNVCTSYADCSEIHKAHPDLPSSIYTITTWNTSSQAKVVCEMDTDGGGWTVFQHRVNGSVDFYRNFSSYETGFGSLHGEFWLGMFLMHEMTSRTTNELRIDIQRASGSRAYAVYPELRIEAGPTYILRIGKKTDYGGISSSEADYLTDTGNGGAVNMAFSTFDRDNDRGGNCAAEYHGAWWYNNCFTYANLNGHYLTPGTSPNSAMTFDNSFSLKTSRMMFRAT